jgi:hypothetical protein
MLPALTAKVTESGKEKIRKVIRKSKVKLINFKENE